MHVYGKQTCMAYTRMPDWMDVFVSPLYKHDSCNPTVLEIIAFWVISAMGGEGGWVPPEGHGGCELHIQLLSATVMDISVDIPKALAVAKYEIPRN